MTRPLVLTDVLNKLVEEIDDSLLETMMEERTCLFACIPNKDLDGILFLLSPAHLHYVHVEIGKNKDVKCTYRGSYHKEAQTITIENETLARSFYYFYVRMSEHWLRPEIRAILLALALFADDQDLKDEVLFRTSMEFKKNRFGINIKLGWLQVSFDLRRRNVRYRIWSNGEHLPAYSTLSGNGLGKEASERFREIWRNIKDIEIY